ncbi:CPBP family glutamic-type intramembrane protease [Noviherbaspirillum massiliense]|uniref:CPBP family glutamic-type intramembrane protease n=1 Tax=Noviherbaspirillum massiliense TaxID=1465823 RepID=UPI00030A2973|nr:CPBP family glutamic-type intramembrane protease [Noviherbaspirillum massiliense]
MNDNALPVSRLRLAVTLWLAGVPGILAVVLFWLPGLLAGRVLSLTSWAILTLSGLQTAVLLAVAVWVGVRFGTRADLHAPAFEALVASRPLLPAFLPQLRPGLVGGLAGAILLILFSQHAPAELASAPERAGMPLSVRVLYGGITEELLLRWGLMSLLVWLLWRILQRSRPVPGAFSVLLAVLASALLFGAGHLPAAHAVAGSLSPAVIAYVVGGNALFGILAGFLFWRFGLEAAMLAHAFAHLLAYWLAAT